MEASAEDGSDDGNDPPSAPSEVLAEFLSAIMQRQYAEALTYCRLILQYEPHNATALGFYPLLQHKLRARRPTGGDRAGAGSSEEASVRSDHSDEPAAAARAASPMELAADSEDSELGDERSGGGSVASQSSLELDSEPSLELSRRTDSGSGCWESSGGASRSDADDNGNAPPPPPALAPPPARGDENDNAAATATSASEGEGEPCRVGRRTLSSSESVASLRRLRAQFACSIK